ncbi:MAG: hypothetical protein GXP24_08955 [Planctomycetes bacterium]|nr:hypothetical protein [Planctomycetota bacterium]
MSRLPIRVVKVGGSLLNLPDLAERLQEWLAEQSPAHHVLVAGGGALVEQVRQWHKLRPLNDEAAHWMCVDLMTVTAQMLHDWLPEIPLVEDDRLLCQRVGERGSTIFATADWLRHSEPSLPGRTLPANWDVTSDAIAARLAIVFSVDELVLLKSALPAGDFEVRKLAEIGYLDPMMVRLASELPPTRLVNFRALPHQATKLQGTS